MSIKKIFQSKTIGGKWTGTLLPNAILALDSSSLTHFDIFSATVGFTVCLYLTLSTNLSTNLSFCSSLYINYSFLLAMTLLSCIILCSFSNCINSYDSFKYLFCLFLISFRRFIIRSFSTLLWKLFYFYSLLWKNFFFGLMSSVTIFDLFNKPGWSLDLFSKSIPDA